MPRRLKPVAWIAIGFVLAAAMFALAVWRSAGQPPVQRLHTSTLAYQIWLATRGTTVSDEYITKFGERPTLGASNFQTIWPGPTDIRPLPASAVTMTLQSTDADDSQGGTGARQVRVKCLDENYELFEETVLLNGLTPVPMTTACLRLWRKQVLDDDIGSSGTNEGDITAENGGTVYGYISAGAGSTQVAVYTVPSGRVAMIRSIFLGTEDQVEVQLWFDVPGVAPQSFRVRLAGQIPIDQAMLCLPAETDFEIRAKSESGIAEIGSFFGVILVDKPSGVCYP